LIVPKKKAFDPIRNPSDELALANGCRFDESRGEDVIDFLEAFCKLSHGKWAGQTIRLMDWQKDRIKRLYGWLREDGSRRFRTSYLEVPKKNGKSTEIAGRANYHAIADGEPVPEVHLNAVDRQQASIIFDEAARMVEASPALRRRLSVIPSRKTIVSPINSGKIVANSADVPSKDGLNPSVVIFDELHRQAKRDMWSVFRYAGAARFQYLIDAITTAGDTRDSICWEQHEKSVAINAGELRDWTHLGIIYAADPEIDDLENPKTWKKANPSLGETIRIDDFRAELEDAKRDPFDWANFLRLRLNIWGVQERQWIEPAAWESCGRVSGIEPFRGLPCFLGLDLSANKDLTALAIVTGSREDRFRATFKYWLPKDSIEEAERRDRVPYREWAEKGWLTLTPGRVVDYGFIRQSILELCESLDVRLLLADPFNAFQFATELETEHSVPIKLLRQGYLSLSGPTKELERAIRGGIFDHDGSPVSAWNMRNAIVVKDAGGNIKLDKQKGRNKIDGAAALVNAFAGALSAEEEESAGILIL
jgi:phage terminase large subunit-like protein